MTARRSMASRKVLRNRGNQLAGWLTSYGLLVLMVSYDPLALYSQWDDGGNGFSGFNVALVLWFGTISLGMFAAFARPHVEIRQDSVVLRNALRDTTIPRSKIEDVDDSGGKYARILAGGRWHRAMGAERSNLAMMTARPAIGGELSRQPLASPHKASDSGTVQEKWRRIGFAEWTLVSLWAGYVVASGADLTF